MTQGGATAPWPAHTPLKPKKPKSFPVHPRLGPLGLFFFLAAVPTLLLLSVALGSYVTDIGYFDSSALLLWFVGGLVMVVVGTVCFALARMPLGYPRPPFAAINPPSAFTPTSVITERPLIDGVPLLYAENEFVTEGRVAPLIGGSDPFQSGGPSRPAATYSSLGLNIAPTKCPRCGWTGSVRYLNCPRCGLPL